MWYSGKKGQTRKGFALQVLVLHLARLQRVCAMAGPHVAFQYL